MAGEIKKLKNQLQTLEKHLNLAKAALRDLERSQKPNFEDVPGVLGTFDGTHMVTKEGERHEVSANYAAKSKILYGTQLKMIEEDGRKFFKQIEKPEAKEVSGILAKKAGKWHLLTDSGSYKISDRAAEFQDAEANMEAVALVPEDNTGVPFAALKRVLNEGTGGQDDVGGKDVEKVEEKKAEKEEKPDKKVAKKAAKTKKKEADTKKIKKTTKKETRKKETEKADTKKATKTTKKSIVEDKLEPVPLDTDDLR